MNHANQNRSKSQKSKVKIRTSRHKCKFFIDDEMDFKMLLYRFRNKKLSVGISQALNAQRKVDLNDDDPKWLQIRKDIAKVVDPYGEYFKKYRLERSVYDIKYHPKANDYNYNFGQLIKLITRLKFHILNAYAYGKEMKNKYGSQQIKNLHLVHIS